jgi:hypothetical protein
MKKIIVTGIVLISLLLFVVEALAETSLKAEVDKTSLTTDEDLTYKLIITSSAKRIPKPKLPTFDGFAVLSNAQTSQISISSGTQKSLLIYVFLLAPAKTGKLRIEPSRIEIEGKSYASEAFKIQVKQGKTKPQVKPEQKSPLPKKSQPETEQPQISL